MLRIVYNRLQFRETNRLLSYRFEPERYRIVRMSSPKAVRMICHENHTMMLAGCQKILSLSPLSRRRLCSKTRSAKLVRCVDCLNLSYGAGLFPGPGLAI
jgi:hypothetical protein